METTTHRAAPAARQATLLDLSTLKIDDCTLQSDGSYKLGLNGGEDLELDAFLAVDVYLDDPYLSIGSIEVESAHGYGLPMPSKAALAMWIACHRQDVERAVSAAYEYAVQVSR